MDLCLAEVVENFDMKRAGTIMALIYGDGSNPQDVLMSSYYTTGEQGTLKTPVPRKGSTIVVCKPKGSIYWIYLATCDGWSWQGPNGDPLEKRTPLFDRGVDRGGKDKGGSGFDSDLVIQNDMGCGLELSQTYGTKGNKIYTKLYTGNKKYVKLNDSNPNDNIELNTGAGSSFKLTAFPTALAAPQQGAMLDTVGGQRFLSRNGKTCMMVQDGSELNFINNSTGFNCLQGANTATAGNINLQSQSGNIHLFTKSPDSKIFIECLPGESLGQPAEPINDIVIRAGNAGGGGTAVGRVIIEGFELQLTTTNLSVQALGSINVQSAGQMNFDAALGINFRSAGPINIDGTAINLNSGLASTATVSNSPGLPINNYGPIGVFQYF